MYHKKGRDIVISDPIERIIAEALDKAAIQYRRADDSAVALDFYLLTSDVYIEVKQFHTDRIAAQMSRADNVIAVQGRKAAEWLANKISLSTPEKTT